MRQDALTKPENLAPSIQFVDQGDTPIRLVSQREAYYLIRHELATLRCVLPPVMVFCGDKSEWQERFLTIRWSDEYRASFGTAALKSTRYGNFLMRTPENEDLFYCNSLRALWYMRRGLVDVVSEEPPILRFCFVPRGLASKQRIEPKENRCVVCGGREDLSRHHVIPVQFRRYFPARLKRYGFHDVLLMCVPCHEKYECRSMELRHEIAREHGTRLNNGGGAVHLSDVGHVMAAAWALLTAPDNIPEDRRRKLTEEVQVHLGKDTITQADLEQITQLHPWEQPGGYRDYGEYVVSRLTDVQAFVERWRQHFVNAMKPQFLPSSWSIEAPVARRSRDDA